MKIVNESQHAALPPLAATIGFFDGVHRGHRFLIDQVKNTAATRGLHTALITFPVHPRRVLCPDYQPRLLSSPAEKLERLAETGADYCILFPFTPELSQLSAKAFMQRLHDRFHIRTLTIGYDHRFGHNRSETFDDYSRYGNELGIYIDRARAYEGTEGKVSSSVIRRLLEAGKAEEAAHCLGYRYSLTGMVVDGRKVGRRIGFPTANLQVACPDKLIPADGVYAVRVCVEGTEWAGMLNIGHRPTLNNGTDRSIEVHILRFSGDIYHKQMSVEFVKYLRPEQKFDTLDALVAQMNRDRDEVAALFADTVV